MLHRSLPVLAVALIAAAAAAQPQAPKPANPPASPPAPAPSDNKQADAVSRSKAADDVVRDVMKSDAQRVWSQAEDAFKSANYGTAEQAYTQLTTTYRDYLTPQQVAQAEANLATTRKNLGSAPGRNARAARACPRACRSSPQGAKVDHRFHPARAPALRR
jgi:hypothetical protein